MTVFKRRDWEYFLEPSCETVQILAIEDKSMLGRYCMELLAQAEGESGEFCLLKDFAVEQTIAKNISIVTDITGLNINTKKMQTALVKKCSELAVNPEFEERLRKVSQSLHSFCTDVCQDVGYSVELDEDIDNAALFKLFSLSLKRRFESLLDKLVEYVNITAEFLQTRIYVFLFLSKFLSTEELEQFVKHCQYQELSLILIEEAWPTFLKDSNITHKGLIIDKEGFEIPKNGNK